jgi:hypothetical protein
MTDLSQLVQYAAESIEITNLLIHLTYQNAVQLLTVVNTKIRVFLSVTAQRLLNRYVYVPDYTSAMFQNTVILVQ